GVAMKAPTATEWGRERTRTAGAVTRVPEPLPRRMLTVLLRSLATARSCLPSPLKSPTATATGATPTGTDPAEVKLGTRRCSSASTWGRQRRPGGTGLRGPGSQEGKGVGGAPWGGEVGGDGPGRHGGSG